MSILNENKSMLPRSAYKLTPELIARFAKIVGDKNAIITPADQAPYLVEKSRYAYSVISPAVLRPSSVAEVSAIVKLANETSTPIVPQGGNTGLTGGQIPHNGEIVLSLQRLDKIREIDPTSNTMTCEAGVTLRRAREAAASVGRLYPLLLPSEGSCTIGGNLATNAGGIQALSYGVARNQMLGLEVVLADGRILNSLNKLKKDNTGYDLRNLFIGSEGTLGVITAAVLRLIPSLHSVETAFVGVPSPENALKLLGVATERAGDAVTSFEMLTRMCIDSVLNNMVGCREPMKSRHQWYLVIELSSQKATGLREVMEEILSTGYELGLVADAVIADSIEQTKAFWGIREIAGEAQRREGGVIGHDISVPVVSVPAFLREADEAVTSLMPGCRPMPFGHLGDGNIHYTVVQPVGADKDEFLAHGKEINDLVHGIVMSLGGSISAEHGIGFSKREYLSKIKEPVALDLIRGFKNLLDPKGILNPGKVLYPPGDS
jgi:FAD/FMN-containing dehydrogenase